MHTSAIQHSPTGGPGRGSSLLSGFLEKEVLKMGSTHKYDQTDVEETREPENCHGSGRGKLYSSQESFLLPLSHPYAEVCTLPDQWAPPSFPSLQASCSDG